MSWSEGTEHQLFEQYVTQWSCTEGVVYVEIVELKGTCSFALSIQHKLDQQCRPLSSRRVDSVLVAACIHASFNPL